MKQSYILFPDCLNITITPYTCFRKKKKYRFLQFNKDEDLSKQNNTVNKETEIQQIQPVHVNLLKQYVDFLPHKKGLRGSRKMKAFLNQTTAYMIKKM